MTLTCEAKGLYPSVKQESCPKSVKKFWRKIVGVSTSFSEQGLSPLLFTRLLVPLLSRHLLVSFTTSSSNQESSFYPVFPPISLPTSTLPILTPFLPINQLSSSADKPCAVESHLIQFLHRRNRCVPFPSSSETGVHRSRYPMCHSCVLVRELPFWCSVTERASSPAI